MQEALNKSEILSLIDMLAEKAKNDTVFGAATDCAGLAQWFQYYFACSSKAIAHPRLAVFSGTHGFAEDDVHGLARAGAYIQQCVSGDSVINHIAGQIDCDLRIYELDQISGTDNFLADGESMSESSFVSATTYGMMAMEDGVGALAIASNGAGSDASAALILGLLTQKSGFIPERFAHIVREDGETGADLVQRYGGYELCAMIGAFLAAKLAERCLIVEGVSGLCLAAIMHEIAPLLMGKVILAVQGQRSDLMVIAEGMGLQCFVTPECDVERGGVDSAIALQNLMMVQAVYKHDKIAAKRDDTKKDCGLSGIKESLEKKSA